MVLPLAARAAAAAEAVYWTVLLPAVGRGAVETLAVEEDPTAVPGVHEISDSVVHRKNQAATGPQIAVHNQPRGNVYSSDRRFEAAHEKRTKTPTTFLVTVAT
jgi:hypothetical protein